MSWRRYLSIFVLSAILSFKAEATSALTINSKLCSLILSGDRIQVKELSEAYIEILNKVGADVVNLNDLKWIKEQGRKDPNGYFSLLDNSGIRRGQIQESLDSLREFAFLHWSLSQIQEQLSVALAAIIEQSLQQEARNNYIRRRSEGLSGSHIHATGFSEIKSISVGKNGLAIVSGREEVFFWNNLKDSKQKIRLPIDSYWSIRNIYSVSFLGETDKMMIFGSSGVKLYDPAIKQTIDVIDPQHLNTMRFSPLYCYFPILDQDQLFITMTDRKNRPWIWQGGASDSTPRLLETFSNSKIRNLFLASKGAHSISHDLRTIAVETVHSEGVVRRFDSSGRILDVYEFNHHIEDIALSPDGKYVAMVVNTTGDKGFRNLHSNEILTYHVESKTLVGRTILIADLFSSLAYSWDGKRIFAGTEKGKIRIVDPMSLEDL